MGSECHVLHSLEFPFLLCSVCLQQRVWDCPFGSVLCLAAGPNTNTVGFKSPSSSQKPGALQEPLWFMAKFPGGSVTSQATLHRILVIPTPRQVCGHKHNIPSALGTCFQCRKSRGRDSITAPQESPGHQVCLSWFLAPENKSSHVVLRNPVRHSQLRLHWNFRSVSLDADLCCTKALRWPTLL